VDERGYHHAHLHREFWRMGFDHSPRSAIQFHVPDARYLPLSLHPSPRDGRNDYGAMTPSGRRRQRDLP
jgi:hypothetical protein